MRTVPHGLRGKHLIALWTLLGVLSVDRLLGGILGGDAPLFALGRLAS